MALPGWRGLSPQSQAIEEINLKILAFKRTLDLTWSKLGDEGAKQFKFFEYYFWILAI